MIAPTLPLPSVNNTNPFHSMVAKDAPAMEVRPPAMTWEKAYQVAAAVFYYLLFPVTFPLKLLVTHVYPFSAVMEGIARLMIFMTDLYKPEFGAWGAFLLGAIGLRSSLDADRLEQTKDRYKLLGATFETLKAEDGEEIEVMHLTQENFRQAVEAQGAFFQNTGTQELIGGGTEELKEALNGLKFSKEDDAFVLRKYEATAEIPKGVVLRIHPYSHTAMLEQKYIRNHLALGKDIITYDSKRMLSEEGMYLDAKTAYEHVRKTYEASDIWVTSKCGGSPAVLFLRDHFKADEFNAVIENSFLRYGATVEQNMPVADWIGMDMLGVLSSNNQATVAAAANIHCNKMNNQEFLERIATQGKDWKNSTIVVISAQQDAVVEPEAGYELARLAAKVSSSCYHLVHAVEPGRNGHRDEALIDDPILFKVYSQILTNNAQAVEL